MARVGTKNTAPEITLRSMIHRMGYRFRIHRKELPGTPDLVFPSRKKVIFVHGCFWHDMVADVGKAPINEFSAEKSQLNRARDVRDMNVLNFVLKMRRLALLCSDDVP